MPLFWPSELASRALANLQWLADEGPAGQYGFYEAIDYTRDRLQPRQRCAIVKCYMAHHQGMSLLALANFLLDERVSRRLYAEPMVRATELLLQERVPAVISPVAAAATREEADPARHGRQSRHDVPSVRPRPIQTFHARTSLSNGKYAVMVTNAGGSYSTCAGLDVTRWREDRTRDNWGQFCYLRDERTGLSWSAPHQPMCRSGR